MKKKIKALLHETGVLPHLMGHLFVCRALEIVMKDYYKLFNLKKEVYTPIAREYGTTSSRVERDIRNAIEVAFSKHATMHTYQYFPHLNQDKGKPTNKEYIATIMNMLK